jgi:integrase/recombinase XerD
MMYITTIMKTQEYLNNFDLALRAKFTSEATIKNYYSCVKSFFAFATGKNIETHELIKQYLVWGIKSKEPKTINLHRSAVVCFFKLVKGIEIKTNSVPRRKERKQLPKIIDIEAIKEAVSKTENIKHKLELLMFFDCGLRLCEMYALRVKNVINGGRTLWLHDTKGNKERIVPVSESVSNLLNVFIADMNGDSLVFGGICKRTFEKVVSTAFERVGVKATPHVLRHSFATYQIMSGENPFKVQSWLGHSSIKTTQTYVHLSNQLLSVKKDLLINGNYTN